MKTFIIIMYAFTTIKRLIPLTEAENWTGVKVFTTLLYVVAFIFLCNTLLTFK